MRTVPSDLHHADAVASLVLHFKWVFVGALAVDDDFGRTGLNQILNEVERKGVCIAFSELLPKVKSQENIHQLGKFSFLYLFSILLKILVFTCCSFAILANFIKEVMKSIFKSLLLEGGGVHI